MSAERIEKLESRMDAAETDRKEWMQETARYHKETMEKHGELVKGLHELSTSIQVMVTENAHNQKRNDEKITDGVNVAKAAHDRIDDVRDEVRAVADDVKEIKTRREMEKSPAWIAGGFILAAASVAGALFAISRILPGG